MVQDLASNIWKFYLFTFFSNLLFIIPVMVLFWQENSLSLTQIMILQSFYALAIVLFEVPTGVIADKFGRKTSLLLGAILLSAGTMIYSLSYGFFQFMIAELIFALGVTFISGADSAFVYDSLKESKKEDDFKRVWGNVTSLNYGGAGIAAIVGGIVASYYTKRLDWAISAVGISISALIALTFIEPISFKKNEPKQYFTHALSCFKESFNNKTLLFLLLFNSILVTSSKIVFWLYQPYMAQSGLDIVYFGIVWASFSVVAILSSKSAHRIESYLNEKWSLWLIIIVTTLATLLMSKFFVIYGFFFIYMHQFIRGFTPPIIQDYTHKHLSTEKRATLMSIQSLAGNLGVAILGPIFGYFVDKFALPNAMLITAISFFTAFCLLMIWNEYRKK